MPKIDISSVPGRKGSSYPPPFGERMAGRVRRALGDAAGLTDFGVNLLHLPPGAWSSQRHWHIEQDEFIYVLSGELTLVTNAGAETLRAGDCAGFKAGDEDGHHLQNRSNADATFLEMGTRPPADAAFYSDIDMKVSAEEPHGTYRHRDGTPYPQQERRGG